ncbi:MAG: hypothetical protein NTW59_03900 [Candidatus Diapherotrites archaeon]|nr:hypothetical protein [Candidatus Diapherotrites archaeon]
MAFWDFLRPISDQAVAIDLVTRAIVLLLSLAMLAIALLAYRKSKSGKALFVSIAFALFAIKWVLKVVDLFVSPGEFFSRPAENAMELLILGSLFVAIFRK